METPRGVTPVASMVSAWATPTGPSACYAGANYYEYTPSHDRL